MNRRNGQAAQAQKHRSLHGSRGANRLGGFLRVRGNDDREIGNRTGPGQVLDGMVRRPELAVRQTARYAAELHIGSRIRDIDLNLLQRAAGEKAGRGANEGHLAAIRQARPDPYHVLLGDSDVQQALGEKLGEALQVRGSHGIVDHRDDSWVALRQFFEGQGEGVPAIEPLRHARPLAAPEGRPRARHRSARGDASRSGSR